MKKSRKPFPIKVGDYIEDQDDALMIANASQSESAKLLLGVVKKKLEESDWIVHNKPKHDPIDLENDIVFLLGMIRMAEFILRFPSECKHHINSDEESTHGK